ncbi:MAG: nucleotide exchange factor GrpE [Thermoplasmatales archaeon]|nr:MAG: nucleotide exchange factor GrpE [Thermoplasmatales archaeon]
MPAKKDNDKKDKSCHKKTDTLELKIKKLKKEVKQLQKDLEEKNDKLLRIHADLQNYQKRMEKELISKEEEIKRKYLAEIIDLNEILKKAYEDKNPKQGLKLILNNLEKFFEKEHIKYIDCMGKSFDYVIHHAVTTVEKNDCESDTIVEEVKKGYMVGDKLLRPSQVIVAKKKENK